MFQLVTGESFFEDFGFSLAEIGIADERAGLAFAEPVIAGIDGDARNPVAKGLLARELVELEEDFGEGFLGDVVVVGGGADLIANDSEDLGRELLDEIPPGRLGSRPHFSKKALIDDWMLFHGVKGKLGRRGKRGNVHFVKSR